MTPKQIRNAANTPWPRVTRRLTVIDGDDTVIGSRPVFVAPAGRTAGGEELMLLYRCLFTGSRPVANLLRLTGIK